MLFQDGFIMDLLLHLVRPLLHVEVILGEAGLLHRLGVVVLEELAQLVDELLLVHGDGGVVDHLLVEAALAVELSLQLFQLVVELIDRLVLDLCLEIAFVKSSRYKVIEDSLRLVDDVLVELVLQVDLEEVHV